MDVLKKLEEQITCPICLEHFTNPKALSCFHSFCLQCLQGVPIVLVEGNHSLPCPTCRSTCLVPDNGLASLPPSFVINNLIEVYELMKKVSAHQHVSCDNCDNTNADHYCKQCAKFFCPECLPHHNKWKPNASHQILSLEEVATIAYQLPHAKQDQAMACTSHNKPLEIFCETCQQLICHDCTVRKHRDHNFDLVTDTYPQHKDTIVQCSLQPLNQEFHRLVAAKQALTNRRNEIAQNAEETNEEIHQTITQIKIHFDEMEKKLTQDVKSASTHKVCVVDAQIKEIDTALGQVAECRDHVEQCVKVGSPQQVLSAKPQIMSRTQSVITSVKDKTFEPLEQPDIQLVKSDTIHQLHREIGKVKCTFHPAKAKLYCRHIPLIKHESVVIIDFFLVNGSPAPVPPSLVCCRLIPPDNSHPIQCSVKESSQSGQCNVVFTPLTRGLHQLHVTVADSNIPGSPFSVPVSVPPEMRNTPIKTITGLNGPSGVAVTDDGLVIVSEKNGHCITILDREGKKMRSFGSSGEGRGQLKYPRGVAITSKGTVLVVDSNNHRIQEFTMEGDCISCVGTKGNGPLQFSYPRGIAINKTTGQVLVADQYNHRVQVLHPDLTFSHMFGSEGSEQGRFKYPQEVAIESQGFVYVVDCHNHRVQKFTPEGQFVSSFGSKGSEPGQLQYPTGITVDDSDLLYVHGKNGYVSVYTANGQYISRIKTNAKYNAENVQMNGLAFDTNGNLYICCSFSNKMCFF